jgi:hypothetical protein
MKRLLNSSRLFKALLLAGLVGSLAFKAMAQPTTSIQWSPLDILTDGAGNPYAYYNDANNWAGGIIPSFQDPATGNYYQAKVSVVTATCVISNNTIIGQLMVGDGGGGNLVITNGAQVQAGVSNGVSNGEWTGVGFPSGPSTLYVGPGSSLTLASHLWVGQGTANGGPNTVTVDGGTINIPNGQLGVSWNGGAGTNYLTIKNGGTVNCGQWAPSSFGYPGAGAGNVGILNLADNSSHLVINGNQTGSFNLLVTNGQFLAYGGLGTITYSYNPALNVSTVSAIAPVDANTPIFSTEPTNVIVAPGGTATLKALVSNVPVNYGWMFNSIPLTDGGAISGSHTATLTITGVTSANIGNYSVVATNQSFATETALSTTASVSDSSFNLFPVITINGVPGNTYVVNYANSLNPPVTWIPLATNTLGGFLQYVIDTNSPLSMKRFYQVVQH